MPTILLLEISHDRAVAARAEWGDHMTDQTQNPETEQPAEPQYPAVEPLSFAAFMERRGGSVREGYTEFATYGSLPEVLTQTTPQDKAACLTRLYADVYLPAVAQIDRVRDQRFLEELVDALAKGVGLPLTTLQIVGSYSQRMRMAVTPEMAGRHLTYLERAQLVDHARRCNLKNGTYLGTPFKFYFADAGLRNVRTGFEGANDLGLVENVVFNELKRRGYRADMGVLTLHTTGENGEPAQEQIGIDFACDKGDALCCIQIEPELADAAALEQAQHPLVQLNDDVKKLIVTAEGPEPFTTEAGVLVMNVRDFLLDEGCLDA